MAISKVAKDMKVGQGAMPGGEEVPSSISARLAKLFFALQLMAENVTRLVGSTTIKPFIRNCY